MARLPAPEACVPTPAWRRHGMRVLGIALVALMIWLLVQIVRETDWNAVLAALRRRPAPMLVLIAAAALTSHAVYGLLDVLGARALQLRLPPWRVWLTATSSYACNLNFGSLVGAAALRFRLYGRQGVAAADVSRLIALSMASNWLGFLLLLASLPLWSAPRALSRWTGSSLAFALSLAAGCMVGLYFYACARRLRWQLRGYDWQFPHWHLAFAQVAVGAVNWALMAALLWLCLDRLAAYDQTLAALLVAAIAGAVTHVPGGWGVLDFIIVRSLAASADAHLLVAGVVVYRAAYYLLPLLLAPLSIAAVSRGAATARAPAR